MAATLLLKIFVRVTRQLVVVVVVVVVVETSVPCVATFAEWPVESDVPSAQSLTFRN